MNDAFAQSALNAAVLRLQAGIGAAVERLADLPAFGTTATGALRQTLSGVQVELRRKLPVFNLEFATVLRDKVRVETAPRQDARRTLASTTWESLSLVDDDEVDERVAAERISLELAHGCEWELRDLDSYVGALQRVGRPDPEHNPLRPEIVAQALLSAIRAVSDDPEHRQHLSREIGRTLGPALAYIFSTSLPSNCSLSDAWACAVLANSTTPLVSLSSLWRTKIFPSSSVRIDKRLGRLCLYRSGMTRRFAGLSSTMMSSSS